jgi:hypothetical protein
MALAVPADAVWVAPVNLSAPGQDAFPVTTAMGNAGDAVVAWTRYDGTHNRVQARRWSRTRALGAVKTLSAAGTNATDPQAAVDAVGDAVMTWRQTDGTNNRIQTRRWFHSGGLSSVEILTDPGQDATYGALAGNAGGHAASVWTRSDSVNDRAAGAYGP